MTTADLVSTPAYTFHAWSREANISGLDPLIYIVGSRGKSTIARLIDTIAKSDGLRTALRTDSGVEFEGKRQLGDLHPLNEALALIDRHELDLGIIEMGWNGLHTLPLAGRTPAAIVVSTICPHREYCQLSETRRAIAGLQALLLSTPPETVVTADLDDAAFPSLADLHLDRLILTTVSAEQPRLSDHLAAGGLGGWTTSEGIEIGGSDNPVVSVRHDEMPLTMDGAALFQLRNVMSAAATAHALGLRPEAIKHGISQVRPDNSHFPTGLNVCTANGVRVLIDRPSPPWFLSPLLRTVRGLKPQRAIFVMDYRDVGSQDDTVEVGKMIGRQAARCIVINEHASLASVVALKAGIAQNETPPPIVHTESVPRAVHSALASARPEDTVVVLTSRAQTVYRALARQLGR